MGLHIFSAITLIKAKKIPTWNKRVKIYVDPSTIASTDLFIEKSFINVIAETGTFAVIAGVAENAPAFIVVPVAILTGT
jgi:hypothetical protein